MLSRFASYKPGQQNIETIARFYELEKPEDRPNFGTVKL